MNNKQRHFDQNRYSPVKIRLFQPTCVGEFTELHQNYYTEWTYCSRISMYCVTETACRFHLCACQVLRDIYLLTNLSWSEKDLWWSKLIIVVTHTKGVEESLHSQRNQLILTRNDPAGTIRDLWIMLHITAVIKTSYLAEHARVETCKFLWQEVLIPV
jgi:hypothetical protein